MVDHEDNQHGFSDPGRFEDLLDALEAHDPDSDIPFEDCAFILSPDEFNHFLDLMAELPYKLALFDYDGEVLYFKSMGFIPARIIAALNNSISDQVFSYKSHAKIGTLVQENLYFLGNSPVFTGQTSYQKPDLSFGSGENTLPALVGEVNYSRIISRKNLDRYQRYLTESRGQVRVVICLDIYYAKGPDRERKTAAKIDRSAVSVWAMNSDNAGQVSNLMEWVSLSQEGGSIDLYLSDVLDAADLPEEFIRPDDLTTDRKPQIRVPFTTIVKGLQKGCELAATQPAPSRVQIRRSSPLSNRKPSKETRQLREELKQKDREIAELRGAKDREIAELRGAKDREVAELRRALDNANRSLRQARRGSGSE